MGHGDLEPTAPSALVVSRLFGFVGILAQSGDPADPALQLCFSTRQPTAAFEEQLGPCQSVWEVAG